MNDTTEMLNKRVAEAHCKKAVQNLAAHHFTAVYCADKNAARDYVMAAVAESRTVGFGGSRSAEDLGLHARVAESGAELVYHSLPDLTPEQRVEAMMREQACDLFVCGANAVTLSGEIVNIDGVGNRVAASVFGPRKIILLVGRNKLVDGDVADAVRRAKAFASTANTMRLDKKTPCATTGFCADCDSPERICNVVVVMERKPSRSDIHVLVVNDDLGF